MMIVYYNVFESVIFLYDLLQKCESLGYEKYGFITSSSKHGLGHFIKALVFIFIAAIVVFLVWYKREKMKELIELKLVVPLTVYMFCLCSDVYKVLHCKGEGVTRIDLYKQESESDEKPTIRKHKIY